MKHDVAKPTVQDLLYIVLLFGRNCTVEHIFKKHIKVFEKIVSIVKLVRFCIVRGIMKRCYEVVMSSTGTQARRFIDREAYMKHFKLIR
jgi:hypothetical protein